MYGEKEGKIQYQIRYIQAFIWLNLFEPWLTPIVRGVLMLFSTKKEPI